MVLITQNLSEIAAMRGRCSPISNPGSAALEAVLRPAITQDLYFVADGSGGHVFSATLKEHNRNAAKWRQLNKVIKKGRENAPQGLDKPGMKRGPIPFSVSSEKIGP